MSFRNGFVRNSIEDNCSKAEFFRSIQVYLEDLVGVMIYQGGGSAQSLLNTQEGCELLGGGGDGLCLGFVGSLLLATEQRLLEECSFERLKGCCKLGIEIDIAPQVAH